ncbi:MAG TPA: hypothetical protein VNS63_00140 [Blastocatellia bacterium]|nr:hypothetical protein [Blastocatellia bacterium]
MKALLHIGYKKQRAICIALAVVIGVRHDAYANKHRIPVEEEKPVGERGSYLYPDAYPNTQTGEQRDARLSIAPTDRRPR